MKNKLVPWKKNRKDAALDRIDNPFDLLHRDINDLFDSFAPGSDWNQQEAVSFELSETDDDIQVKAELPGMDEKDIDVSLDENTLVIRGEHREESEKKKRNVHVSQMSCGSVYRSIQLPAEVDASKANALFKRGVLTLTFPKTERAKAARRRIPITVN
jgi:HSP20 family protein